MRYTIDEIKVKVSPIAKNYGIRRASLFGSYARGTANDNSDIDICIDKGRMRSLIQYFAFINDLEKSLQCHVDVVTSGIQDEEFLNNILRDEVLLYEE